MSEEMLDVTDASMREKFSRELRVEDSEGRLYTDQLSGHTYELVPEDIMAKIQDFVGDGRGSLTVGADLSTSVEFGCKAGAFLNVRVICDNSMEAVEEVHGILVPWVREKVEEDYREVEDIRTRILSGEAPKEKIVDAAPKKATGDTPSSRKRKPTFRR